MSLRHRRRIVHFAVAALLGAMVVAVPAAQPLHVAAAIPQGVKINHVWIIMIENTSTAFTGDTYLSTKVKSQGAYIASYYGIGHESADNYLALISGQGPQPSSQADCQNYQDVAGQNAMGSGMTQEGQWAAQSGCVYPKDVNTIGQQIDAKGLTWKGYMEDLNNDKNRDGPVNCDNAQANADMRQGIQDPTQNAEGPNAGGTQTKSTSNVDQYALRHNPFMYFHANIDNHSYCAQHVVPLQDLDKGLRHDLASVATTPNYSFITPNLCNDGHDVPSSSTTPGGCAGNDAQNKTASGPTAVDDFLQAYLPLIIDSKAFRQDGGMVVITADETGGNPSPNSSPNNAGSDPYSASCCNEQSAATCVCSNSQSPGIDGFGGGKIGAVVLSPYITLRTTVAPAYNHFSLLRTIEDLFHLSGGTDGAGHLGWAGSYQSSGYVGPCDQPNGASDPCQPDFGADVFSDPSGRSYPNVDVASSTSLGSNGLSNSNPNSASQSGSNSSAAGSGNADLGSILGFGPGLAAGTPVALRTETGSPTTQGGSSPTSTSDRADLLGLLGPHPPGTSGFSFLVILVLVVAPLLAMAGALVLIRRGGT